MCNNEQFTGKAAGPTSVSGTAAFTFYFMLMQMLQLLINKIINMQMKFGSFLGLSKSNVIGAALEQQPLSQQAHLSTSLVLSAT
jgi:hypothetical protein